MKKKSRDEQKDGGGWRMDRDIAVILTSGANGAKGVSGTRTARRS